MQASISFTILNTVSEIARSHLNSSKNSSNASEFKQEFMRDGWEEKLRKASSGWESLVANDGSLETRVDVQALAAEALLEFMISLKRKGSLKAKAVCILAYWIHTAGQAGVDACAAFAMSPDSQSGQFSVHLDLVLGLDRKDPRLYELHLPVYSRHSMGRDVQTIYALPPHEALEQEVLDHPEVLQQHQEALDEGNMPPNYYQHPEFKSKDPRPLLGLAIYSDSTEFLHRDSLWALYVYFHLTGRRHLCLVIRKSQFCKCGCRGWCTQWAAWRFVAWSFMHARIGIHPSGRHDCLALDELRAARAGRKMLIRMILNMLKGDNGELAIAHGFPTTKDGNHPCILCHATQAELMDFAGVTSDACSKPLKTRAELEAATRACEFKVVVNRELYLLLRASLDYDQREDGYRGRYLRWNMKSLGLKKGDRLEPSPTLPNIGEGFDTIDEFPCTILFWRRSKETLCRHRNPLFAPETGIDPYDVICIDGMHTNSEGTVQQFCSWVVHHFVNHDLWKVGRAVQLNHFNFSIMRMQTEFKLWCSQQNASFGCSSGEKIDCFQFGPSSFGTATQPSFHMKAGQSNTFLRFILDVVRKYQSSVPRAAEILSCGKHFLFLVSWLKDKPYALLPEEKEHLMSVVKAANLESAALGVHMIPKHHLMVHWGLSCHHIGNPDKSTVWADEHLNGILVPIAAAAHACNFSARILIESKAILSDKKPFKKRKKKR